MRGFLRSAARGDLVVQPQLTPVWCLPECCFIAGVVHVCPSLWEEAWLGYWIRGHKRCMGGSEETSNLLWFLGDERKERGRECREGRLPVSFLQTRKWSTVLPGDN